MNKIKTIVLLFILSFGLQLSGQQAEDALDLQKNIDDIFDQYGEMQSKIKSWSKKGTTLEEDSFKHFNDVYVAPLIKNIQMAEIFASSTQNVLVQFYAIQTYSNATKFLRKYGKLKLALGLNDNYSKLLGFKTEVNGLALTHGVLRNISMEKIDIAQFNYLYQLYALANESNDQKLLFYTSKKIVNNTRAGLIDQSLSAMYLFEVFHAQNNFKEAFVYAQIFLNKFGNLSYENRDLVKNRTKLSNQSFVQRFYQSAVEVYNTDKKLVNAQDVAKYGEIGKKYEIPLLYLHMQTLLVRMGQIDEKGQIEDLLKQTKNLKDATLYNFLKEY